MKVIQSLSLIFIPLCDSAILAHVYNGTPALAKIIGTVMDCSATFGVNVFRG